MDIIIKDLKKTFGEKVAVDIPELTIHSGEISTLVQKTGINSLGQNETIYSKITQTESSLLAAIPGRLALTESERHGYGSYVQQTNI